MNMIKKIKHIAAAIVLLAMAGCDDSFLDMTNRYGQNTDTFYKTPADFDGALAGVYNTLYLGGSGPGLTGAIEGDEQLTSELMADIMLGGGGPDDRSAKNMDSFQDPNDDTYRDLWKITYNGIFRANNIIEKIPTADFSTYFDSEPEAEAFRNKILGEAYFMRAFLFFRAAKFFGGMPLIITTTTALDLPRATIPETYGQIASDLKQAIDILPEIDPASITPQAFGHANHWVAQAYMARVYLFYTGYMTNIENQSTTDITLPGGGTITKQNVIDELTDCVNNSGYELVSDFRNLWPYSNVNESAGSTVLPWADTEGLEWVGQDGFNSTNGTGNTEVMFSIRYAFGNWGWTNGQIYTNRPALFFSIRGNSLTPFGQGWGWGTVHPLFFTQWADADPRKLGSVLEVGKADEGTSGYSANQGDHETGLFCKKYHSLQHGGAKGTLGMFRYMYGDGQADYMLWHAQDFYHMRFADVLLMLSELTEDATYMNQVRDRVGLPGIAYSLDALKKERMYELAFEGLRWFDMVRWGDVEDESNNYYDSDVAVKNSGVPATYSVSYRPETKALISIPESEIRLSNGVYQQNPGW